MTRSDLDAPSLAFRLGASPDAFPLTLDDGTECLIDLTRVDPLVISDAIRRGLTTIIDDKIAELREASLADLAIASTYLPA